MIQGISHMTFIVQDLDRMERVLMTVFDARKVYDSGTDMFSISRERFFLVGEDDGAIWIATMEGESLPSETYNHIAFKIQDEDYDKYLARVEELGLKMREGRARVRGEGQSIYFYDHDNHMFELHTGTLEERLARYAKGHHEDHK